MERILAWYRVGSSVGAVVALVVANAIPLIGVLFLGWSVWNILVIYWLENGIVGVFNVLKMARADGSQVDDPLAVTMLVNGRPAAGIVKFAIMPFFVVHYGLFWVVHGVFVLALPLFASISGGAFGPPMMPSGDSFGGPPTPAADSFALSGGSIALAVIALAVSHGLSYWWNFIRGGEYRRTTPVRLMFAPYRRLVALHLTIIFGALAIVLTGAPVAAIAVLVVVKILLDLGLHLAEHRPSGAVAPAPGTIVGN